MTMNIILLFLLSLMNVQLSNTSALARVPVDKKKFNGTGKLSSSSEGNTNETLVPLGRPQDVPTYMDVLSTASRILHPTEDVPTHSRQNTSSDIEAILLFSNFLASQKASVVSPDFQYDFEFTSGHGPENQSLESNGCLKDLHFLIYSAVMKAQWALEMLDASGKPGSGILRENVVLIGDFDECMDVETGQSFNSRFCSTIVLLTGIKNTTFSTPVGFYLGVCIPSSCGATEVESYLNGYFQSQTDIMATAIQPSCQERHLTLSTKAIIVICICSVYAVVLVVCTVFDVVDKIRSEKAASNSRDSIDGLEIEKSKKCPSEYDVLVGSEDKIKRPFLKNIAARISQTKLYKSGTGRKVIRAFSVYTNFSKLVTVHQTSGSIDCINGMRFFSNSWVILIHVYGFGINVMENVKPYMEKSHKRWTFETISNALVCVDTFFAMSGFLLTYLTLKDLGKKELNLKYFRTFYLHRFWRLTPPYMLIMMTYVPLVKYISDGPFWPQGGTEVDECEGTWWTNLLYINNLVKTDKMCMSWTWYLACDMQLYVISPLLILPLFFFDWQGLVVPLVFLLGSAVSSGLISDAYAMQPNIDITDMASTSHFDYFNLYYIKPYTRMGPYLVGMITGYLMFKWGGRTRLPKLVVALGWTAATAIALAVIYGLYEHYQGDPISTEEAALYNALHQIAWGISICWVVFACANGYGGFVNTLLSWKALVPLSRLTYCAYLVHPIVLFYFFFSQRKPFYMDNINIAYVYTGMVTLAYAVALLAYLAFEAPMTELEKIIRGRGQK